MIPAVHARFWGRVCRRRQRRFLLTHQKHSMLATLFNNVADMLPMGVQGTFK